MATEMKKRKTTFTLMILRGLGPGRPPPALRLFSLHRYTVKKIKPNDIKNTLSNFEL